MEPKKFSETTLRFFDRLIDIADANKQLHPDKEVARHWAIFRTELEKVKAYYNTYLSDADTIVSVKGDS